jgi:ligand-binding sensor domain-containing protein/two-component sensor histidine kinase
MHSPFLRKYSFSLLMLTLTTVGTQLPVKVPAQQYNFRNYSLAEGLAQSQVYAMCQDRRGNLWLGTRGGGVSIFDGINFSTISEDDGLVNNYINAIMEDRHGNIWIATDEGVSRYDGRHFTNYTTREGLCANTITCLHEDRHGTILMGSNSGGLSKWIGGKFVTFNKRTGYISNNISCILETGDGDLWIGTDAGIMKINDYGSIQKFTSRNGLPSNDIRHMIQDRKGRIWIATYTGGICCYDSSLFKVLGTKDGLSSEKAIYLLEDKKGNIWTATYDAGACKYDGAHFYCFRESQGLCNDALRCLLQDNQGNIWFGSSSGGISRFDSERFTHFPGNTDKLGNLVYAIHEDHLNRMWFASSIGGVTRLDSGRYVSFRKEQGFTNYKVRCIYEDPGGRLWFGTIGDGVFIYDGHAFTHIGSKNGMSSNFINDITSDRYDNIWFATAGGGACKAKIADIDSNKRIRFTKFNPRNGLGADRVLSIMADTLGNIWLATLGGGLEKLSSIGDSVTSVATYSVRPNGTNIVRTVTTDGKGHIWVGTGGDGVAWFDGQKFHTFTKKEGLSSSNIYLMTFDNSGNLWVGTEKGVDKISLTPALTIRSISHYSRPEGFTGIETNQNAVCVDHKGNLWFGTVNGTTMYKAADDHPDAQSPSIHITGIRLFFDKVEETPYGKDSLSPWYAIPKHLILPYNKNQLSFDFTGINLRNPEHVLYQWMLVGFDKGWSPSNSSRLVTYNNLPPGNYTFLVKSANEDGIWNSAPAKFAFTIIPPFWQTLWFRISTGALIIFVTYILFSLRLRSVRRKNKAEKDKLELEKNVIELEQQALLLQMNPHFIFNSLNSIQAYITRNDPVLAKKYLAKFAKLMRQILQNSTESAIPLHEEVNMLQNYLDLEKLCHNDKFDYVIDADPSIDLETTYIPPMLIQPFIENAVLHGIAPLKEQGHIKIHFSRNGKKNEISCTIKDNGIGINHALSQKNQNPEDHKSMAFKVTEKRLEMMTGIAGKTPPVVIRDTGDLSGPDHGTEVVLKIPTES